MVQRVNNHCVRKRREENLVESGRKSMKRHPRTEQAGQKEHGWKEGVA